MQRQQRVCERAAAATRAAIGDANRARRTGQCAAGERSRTLEEGWVALGSKNFELELLCAQMEGQLALLEGRRDGDTPLSAQGGRVAGAPV